MPDRANQLITDILRRIHEAIVENDITYEEYQTAKQWLIDVGEAGEWPLFGDVYIEHVVEEQAFGNRSGSQGTILGPFHLPDAPLLEAPFELPRRPDEPGDPTLITGRVTDVDGAPLAGANLDVWQADAEGRYAGFMPGPPDGNLRGQVRTDDDGRYEIRTVVPGPYTIPLDGPTGKMTAAAGWSPWRPAHVHLIVCAEGYRAARHPAVHRHQRLPRQRRRQRGQGRADRPSRAPGRRTVRDRLRLRAVARADPGGGVGQEPVGRSERAGAHRALGDEVEQQLREPLGRLDLRAVADPARAAPGVSRPPPRARSARRGAGACGPGRPR